MNKKVDYFFYPKAVLFLPGRVWSLAVEFILLALSLLPWSCLCSSIWKLCYCCCSFAFRIIWKPSSYIYGWLWGKIILTLDLVKVSLLSLEKLSFNSPAHYVLGFEADLFEELKPNCIWCICCKVTTIWLVLLIDFIRKCVACCEAWLVNLVYWWQTWLKTFR